MFHINSGAILGGSLLAARCIRMFNLQNDQFKKEKKGGEGLQRYRRQLMLKQRISKRMSSCTYVCMT